MSNFVQVGPASFRCQGCGLEVRTKQLPIHHRCRGKGAAREAPCRFRAAVAQATVLCSSCRGKIKLKVFGCDLHGKCTVSRKVEGMACCGVCVDYQG